MSGRLSAHCRRLVIVEQGVEISVRLAAEVEALLVMLALWLTLKLSIEEGVLGDIRILRIKDQILYDRLCLFAICIVRLIQVTMKLHVATIF